MQICIQESLINKTERDLTHFDGDLIDIHIYDTGHKRVSNVFYCVILSLYSVYVYNNVY